MSDQAETLKVNRDRGSAMERAVGEILVGQLSAPWSVEATTAPLTVASTDVPLTYTPDMMITNGETGEVLAIEINTPLSLSIPNVLKLKQIQTAFEEVGTDFLVIVESDTSDARAANIRLSEFGVNAIGVNSAGEAAAEIVKHLGV